MSVRIVLADDHPVVRGGLRALLATIDGFEVVGEAADGEAAVREAQLLRPDVVLMDVRMPGLDGVEATRRIRDAAPDTAVLMLTMYDDDATVFTAMQAGARGYLLKGAEQEEIVGAIRAVVAGQAIFGPGIAAPRPRLLLRARRSRRPREPFPELTDREREILDLLAAGPRTAAIAATLFLSPKTVSNHLTSIFAKLEVADRAEAIVRAREGGLGRGPGSRRDLGAVLSRSPPSGRRLVSGLAASRPASRLAGRAARARRTPCPRAVVLEADGHDDAAAVPWCSAARFWSPRSLWSLSASRLAPSGPLPRGDGRRRVGCRVAGALGPVEASSA